MVINTLSAKGKRAQRRMELPLKCVQVKGREVRGWAVMSGKEREVKGKVGERKGWEERGRGEGI